MKSDRKADRAKGRQTLKRTLRNWLPPLAAGAVLLAILWLMANMTWKSYRTALIDSQTRQLELVVQSTADSIRFSLEEYADRLDAAAERVRNDPQARPSLARSDTLADLWIEDCNGNVIYRCYGLAPVRDTLLTYTSEIRYWQYHQGDHHYLVMQQPVGDQSVCLVIDSEVLYRQLISDLHVGSNGYIVLKNASNRIIMHPEPTQWGISILEGRQKLYNWLDLDMESLDQLLENQQTRSSGITDYYSYWWTDPSLPRVHKISAYRQLQVGSSFWIVSAVVDYDDLYQPVVDSFRKMAVMFSGIALILILLTVFIFHLQSKNQKSAREINALQDVNKALEELHRSEESLQHGQRLQLMGTLTGGIAHEFNNFLTPIAGYADLIMADADPDSEIYDNALEISEAAEKARDVVKQISAMSRRNVETIYDAVPVEKMLVQVRKLAETNCPKQIHIEEQVDLNGEKVLGNMTQLQQVLLNICINGIHAIGDREGTLNLHADMVSRSEALLRFPDEKIPQVWSSFVRIRITDTGSGMDKETLQHIFEPFFTTKKAGEGTGLGLALAEQIIRTHRGHICAESTPGKGSTFYIYLPVLEQEREKEQLRWGQENALHLLAADDNQKVLRLLKEELSRLGMTVSTCARREDMLALLGSQPFDVLAIDESLTEGSGVDFCMSIRGRFPNLTRIIMASAPSRELIEARNHGVIDGYLLKPVSASTLLEIIRTSQRHDPADGSV